MGQLQSEPSAMKFLYLLIIDQNKKYLARILRNWDGYYQIYLQQIKPEKLHRKHHTQLT